MIVFPLFIHKYTEKQKIIHREIKSVHWHFGSSIGKNLLFISYKKGGIEEIKSTQIEFFSLIHYVYVTYRYNLDEHMIVLVRKCNN
jgi:hypothetical protein